MNEAPYISTPRPRIALLLNAINDLTIPSKRKNPHTDSIAADLQAACKLAQLFATGAVKPGEKATKWYNHPQYAALFAAVAQGKLRKYLKTHDDQRFEATITKSKALFLFLFLFTHLLLVIFYL